MLIQNHLDSATITRANLSQGHTPVALQPSANYLSLSVGKAGIRALALGLFESFKEKGIHVATVTVAAFVSPGSNDAEAVAEHF